MSSTKSNPLPNSEILEGLHSVLVEYRTDCELDLSSRWEAWELDLSTVEMFEVVGALLARVSTLAVEFLSEPRIWNQHIAPIILRAMADAYISLAWILRDPLARSRKYIEYGLGQAKLEIEHRKVQLEKDGLPVEEDSAIEYWENWINSQQYTFLTNVNVGSWSGISTRKMAEEANVLDFYNYIYTPFSSGTHNMWNHIAIYNMEYCGNPLHMFHKIPMMKELVPEFQLALAAASFADRAFRLFDRETRIEIDEPKAYKNLDVRLDELGTKLNANEN